MPKLVISMQGLMHFYGLFFVFVALIQHYCLLLQRLTVCFGWLLQTECCSKRLCIVITGDDGFAYALLQNESNLAVLYFFV